MHAGIAAYIRELPAKRKARALETYKAVKSVAPKAEEAIKWNMPAFEYNGKFVAFANRAAYFSIYLGRQELTDMITAKHPKIKCGKSCLNVTDSVELPPADLKTAFMAAPK